MILILALSVEHRLVTYRQTDHTAYTALAWRRAVKTFGGRDPVDCLRGLPQRSELFTSLLLIALRFLTKAVQTTHGLLSHRSLVILAQLSLTILQTVGTVTTQMNGLLRPLRPCSNAYSSNNKTCVPYQLHLTCYGIVCGTV